MKTFTRIAALAGLSLLVFPTVRALDFNMDGSTGVVGTIRSGEPASIADEVAYANWLLGLGADVTDVHNFGNPQDPYTFKTSLIVYNGSVSAIGAMQDDQNLSGSGWMYVLAKYDGPNGGDVLWYVGGAAFTLPDDSFGLWVNKAGEGYALSHWTGFGSTQVPDGGMTALLLALGLAAITAVLSRHRIT
jgi:hypothetical protein